MEHRTHEHSCGASEERNVQKSVKETKSICISEKNFTIQWGLMTPKKQYNRIETGTKRALDLRSILNKIFRLTKRNVHQGSRKCVFSGFAG